MISNVHEGLETVCLLRSWLKSWMTARGLLVAEKGTTQQTLLQVQFILLEIKTTIFITESHSLYL